MLPLWQNYYPRSCRKMGQLLCKRRGGVHNDITSNCITFLRARTNPPRVSEVIVRGIEAVTSILLFCQSDAPQPNLIVMSECLMSHPLNASS